MVAQLIQPCYSYIIFYFLSRKTRMLNKSLACLSVVFLLSGCGGAKYVADESGDGAESIFFPPLVTREVYIDSRQKDFIGKLSPNYYDYSFQYYLQYLNGLVLEGKPLSSVTPGLMSKGRDISGSMAAFDLFSSSILGSPSRFGGGFNVAMIGLSLIAPKSPEETFASWARFYYLEAISPTITFIRVDSIFGDSTDQDIDRIFSKRFFEMRSAVRSGNFTCDKEKESLQSGLYRESSILRSECVIDGKSIKFSRKSWLSMPGSFAREYLGPSIVSRVTFRDVGTRRFDALLSTHAKLLQDGWVAIYPEFSGGIASKIVVAQAGVLKRFDPPHNPFPAANK